MFKRFRLLAFLSIVLLSSFAYAQDDVVTVTLWTETTLQEQLDYLNDNLVAPFEELHPNINLEITGQEGIQDLMRTAILGGTAPDILTTSGPGWNAEYIAGGFMESLQPYADQYGWEEKLLPWAYATGTADGVLYTVPTTYESIAMFYNKTFFDEMGWTPPTNRAELEALAAAAQEAGIHPLTYGNQGQVFANGHILSAYLNNYIEHDDLRAALLGEKPWTDEEFVEVINLLTSDMVEKVWWSGGVDNYYQYGAEDYWAELANREAALIIVGTWGFDDAPTYFSETTDEWDWAPVPNMNETPRPSVYPLAIGGSLAINANSDVKDEAALVFDYLISNPEAVLRVAAGFNFSEWLIPLEFSVEDFPAEADQRVIRFQEELGQASAAGDFGYANWTFWPGPANTHLRTEIESVWEGLTTVENYLADHQAVWDEIYASGNAIPIP